MGSGDLNMKKSWHPLTLANQWRVAEEKQKAQEEARRAAKLQKELREERHQEELERLNATVTKKTINKLEWMYSAPSTGAPQSAEDLEAYLLGKRDASELVARDAPGQDVRKPDDKWKDGLFAFSNRNANSERDAMAKASEDPLAEIRRREQAAAQAMAQQTSVTADGRAGDKAVRGKDRERREERRHRHKHRRRDDRESEPSRQRSRSRDRHHRRSRHSSHTKSRRRSQSPSAGP
ncbi:RNA-splicing factor [Coemansia biformis]|uniref:RNA-splicing factor n=1 Tax=Coemansia biformis TaxID=1286918 RepID=A0A9W7YDV0_9FUNG|nr:RNA-splicing factor [Coemansia biformis]